MRTATPALTWSRIIERIGVGDRRGDLDAAVHRPGMHHDRVRLHLREPRARSCRRGVAYSRTLGNGMPSARSIWMRSM